MTDTFRHTVLIVDDDEGARYAKSRIFGRAGYSVLEAANGRDALELIQQGRPQLVLLDVGLPDINGIEICRRIKTDAATEQTMVLQVSASSVKPEDKALGLAGGADVYLTEPLEATELLGAAKALLRLYDREEEKRVLLSELTQRERFIKKLVDAAPSTVYLYDLSENRNIYANAKLEAALGYAAEGLQLVGQEALQALVHEEDLPQVRECLKGLPSLADGEVIEFECRIRHRSGEWRWFHSRNVIFARDREERPVQILGTAQDITDRKRQEGILNSQKEQQQLLLEISRMILEVPSDPASWTKTIYEKVSFQFDVNLCLNYVVDEKSKDLHLLTGVGVPEYVAQAAQRLHWGQSFCGHVAACGTSMMADSDLIASDPKGDLMRTIGIRAYACHALKASDGQVLGTLSFGTTRRDRFTEAEIGFFQTLCHLIAIAWERHRAASALAERESRLKAMVEGAVDGIIIIDEQGIIHSANPAVERLFDYRLDDLLGRHIMMLMPYPYSSEHETSPASDFDISGLAFKVIGAEMTGVRKDGSRFPVELSISRNQRGGDVTYTGLLRDITERKKAQEQTRRWTIELEQRVAERTQALMQSRTRLRALASELTLTEQRERQRLASELHDYLAQLLVFGRMKVGQAKRGDLGPALGLVQELDDMLNEALTYTRSLVAQLSPPVLREFGLVMAIRWLAEQMRRQEMTVVVHCDLEQVQLREDQAVLLFQSARELLINVSKHAGTLHASVSVWTEGDVLHVRVADEGTGFDPAGAAANLTTPMFGLFSIRERMDALGGHMTVESSPGGGTKVTLAVPYEDAPAEDDPGGTDLEKSQTAAGADPVERSGPKTARTADRPATVPSRALDHSARTRVLLVDDHAMLRQGLRTVLDGYPDIEVVGEAVDGAQAITLAKALSPHVVIMDVNMPGIDGIEATHILKAEQPAILVIGLSVHNNRQVEQVMREAGAVSFLAKDAAIEQLHETIQQALRAAGSTL
jgi:PAS domain S-box-containing protein